MSVLTSNIETLVFLLLRIYEAILGAKRFSWEVQFIDSTFEIFHPKQLSAFPCSVVKYTCSGKYYTIKRNF